MNFITFPVAATNVFPAANSTSGSQLVTEYNLKSRESVATDSAVIYPIGPSYIHGANDFEVSILSDAGGAIMNSYTLAVAPGRGVINGHYVETLVPMTVDLVEANALLAAQSRNILKGDLSIGIRTFFATEQTIAGSLLVENDDDMFLGVQLVVLPTNEMITPSDSPLDQSKVTADIVLASFTFLNNTITNLVNSKTKTKWLKSDRVDIEDAVSNKYVTKVGLNSKKLYAFAGKGVNPETGYDTWEDVTDSMIVWDNDPQRTSVKPVYKEAQFVIDDNNEAAYVVLPHKQVTGMTDDDGNYQYYQPKILNLPIADYSSNTTGLVSKSYTNQIKSIATQVRQFKTFVQGKQIYFIDERSTTDELPAINPAWEVGDYILVRSDLHYTGETSDTSSAPSTMYVILPGVVTAIKFITQVNGDATHEHPIPTNITGVELSHQDWYESSGKQRPETQIPEYYPEFYAEGDDIRGVPGNESADVWVDYFRLRYYEADSETYAYTDYYYGILSTGPREWSDAVLVTGSVDLATEDNIGGFLNVSEDAVDYGYVILDDTGHLRLMDYALLRSGTLAYQIGSDITVPASDSYAEIQAYLTEYVNDRVAFPSTPVHSTYCPIIHIYLNLSATDTAQTLEIGGIDSRFNTAVCLHILGDAGSNVTINISDCEKFMIDPTIGGTPVINIFRTCLFYDTLTFNYIKTCTRDTSIYGTYTGFRDLSLWYEQLTSENLPLVVSGMTVSELDSPIISSDIDYWKAEGTAANDNNYLVALKSITFSGEGDIVGCEVLAANNSTDNVIPGDKIIVGDFILPQGENLIYPTACLTRVLKVTGQFTSAYYSDGSWYVTDNSFTLATGTYNALSEAEMTGTVAFHSVTTLVPSTISQTSIDVWEPDAYNVFRGGAIS